MASFLAISTPPSLFSRVSFSTRPNSLFQKRFGIKCNYAGASIKNDYSSTTIDIVADVKSERVVVLGGSGFVGSAICKAAVSKGIEVISLSRSGRPSSTSSWADQVTWVPGYQESRSRFINSRSMDSNVYSLDDDTPSTMPPSNEVDQDVGNKRKATSMASSNVLNDDPKEERHYLENKGKKRANYWDSFKEYITKSEVKKAECKFCEKTFASDSTLVGTKNAIKCSMKSTVGSSGTQSQVVEGSEESRLQTWVANAKNVREAISYMIIVDELPFRIVQKAGFRHLLSVACPNFKMLSYSTIRRDCYQLYLHERLKLKLFLQNSCQRVCVTTDSWTSCQRVNYMCLTAHFIDNDWKLQKRILNFCPVLGHKGEKIGKSIEACLLPWGLDGKLFTVTVDNASSNEAACNYLIKMATDKGWVSDGKYLHMRCIAHIFNLIVWDGLKDYKSSISRVRNAIKYVRNSPKRLESFKQCVEFLKIDCKLSLCLDVSTRWNSTYLMLDTALKYRRVFDRTEFPTDFDTFEEDDDNVDKGSPQDEDWAKVTSLVTILKKFYD